MNGPVSGAPICGRGECVAGRLRASPGRAGATYYDSGPDDLTIMDDQIHDIRHGG